MKCLEVITLEQSEYWNEIVKSFVNYDVYYLSNYVKAFQIHGDGDPILFYYKDKYIRAINVAMKRDIGKDSKFNGKIPLNTYFDLSTPYGYGGFLIEGDINEKSIVELNHEYEIYCHQNNIVSEFVRFHPILNNHKNVESIYEVVDLGKTVSIDLKSPQYIWENITSKNRNVIRKALKNGIKIYWGRDLDLINIFKKMYNDTMARDNADKYYYFSDDFYNSIINDLKYHFLIFYAVFEEKIIAMSIILFSNKQMHYHLSASVKEYLHLAPTNLLLYEVACWGANNGYSTLHLGGGLGAKEDNLYKFKKSFNKNSYNTFYIGKKIFDNDKYNELVNIRCKEYNFDRNTSFFPTYRG